MMRDSRLFRNMALGVKNLMLHKSRSLLTTLGVVFGVSSVIAMLAVGEGASREALEQIRKLGSQNIILSSVKPADDTGSVGQRPSRLVIYGLRYADNTRILELLPSVVRTVPVRLERKRGHYNGREMDLRVVGTSADWFDLVRRELIAGRYLRASDDARREQVCVLTEQGARKLLATEAAIGSDIALGQQVFRVVGIVQTEVGGTTVQVPDEEIDVYVPISSALERFGEVTFERTSGALSIEKVELHKLLIEIDSVEHVRESAAAIEAMLQHFHDRKDYRVSVPLSLLREAEGTKRRFNIVLGSIAGISLLVGGIGIMNIMLATVTERTREIGIRRAIGARRRQILHQFLVETVVLSGTGGLIGVGVGVLIPWSITQLTGMPTAVRVHSTLLALVISVGIGIVFGIYPALRAAQLDPIEALRHE